MTNGMRLSASHARAAALLLLAVVTAVGVGAFATGDWQVALGYWRGQLGVLPWVVALGAADVALEGLAALWVYERFGVRALDRWGFAAGLAMRAALLVPAQLGRLVRPDVFVRLGRGRATTCLKAEGGALVLDAVAMLALATALFVWRWLPLAAPLAGVAVVAGLLALGRRVSGWLPGSRFALPEDFWWRGSTLGIVLVGVVAWLAQGAAFWLLVRGLPGHAAAADAILAAIVSSVAGAGTGAPGGLGVTDGLLGVSLRWMSVPAAHLALVVLGFRLATFWVWIPIGWAALALTRRGEPHARPIPATDRA